MIPGCIKWLAGLLLLGGLALGQAPNQQAETPVELQLKTMLMEFLNAASRQDKPVFDRFFSNDLIYTRSTGQVMRKADIMAHVDEKDPSGMSAAYDGDDITVRELNDSLAVVNFRLIQRLTATNHKMQVHYFRNTGTFLKRNGQWQVVAWQATAIAPAVKSAGGTAKSKRAQ